MKLITAILASLLMTGVAMASPDNLVTVNNTASYSTVEINDKLCAYDIDKSAFTGPKATSTVPWYKVAFLCAMAGSALSSDSGCTVKVLMGPADATSAADICSGTVLGSLSVYDDGTFKNITSSQITPNGPGQLTIG